MCVLICIYNKDGFVNLKNAEFKFLWENVAFIKINKRIMEKIVLERILIGGM